MTFVEGGHWHHCVRQSPWIQSPDFPVGGGGGPTQEMIQLLDPGRPESCPGFSCRRKRSANLQRSHSLRTHRAHDVVATLNQRRNNFVWPVETPLSYSLLSNTAANWNAKRCPTLAQRCISFSSTLKRRFFSVFASYVVQSIKITFCANKACRTITSFCLWALCTNMASVHFPFYYTPVTRSLQSADPVYPRRHETSTLSWYNVEPESQAIAQHYTKT